MDINMTGQAVREHLQLFLVMRFRMALPAIRDLAMLLVTHYTGDLSMFTRCPLPLRKNTIMTAATGIDISCSGQAYLQWRVNTTMTRCTF